MLVKIPFIGGRLINPDYWIGIGIVPIILAGYYFNGVFSNFAAGCHITKRTELLPIAVGISAAVNIILNFLLIPVIGIWGGAWSTFIAYFISAVILYFLSYRIYPLKYEWKRLAIIIASAFIAYWAGIKLSSGFDSLSSSLIKLGFFAAFFLMLIFSGFLTKGELTGIKTILRGKIKSN